MHFKHHGSSYAGIVQLLGRLDGDGGLRRSEGRRTPLHIHLHIHEADAENHSPHSEMGISNFTDLHASLAATSSSGADPRSMEDDLSTVAEPTTSMAGVPLQHSEMETSYSTESCAFSATTCLVGSAPLSVAGDLNTEVEPAISTGAAHADHDSGQCVNARRSTTQSISCITRFGRSRRTTPAVRCEAILRTELRVTIRDFCGQVGGSTSPGRPPRACSLWTSRA